MDYFTLAELRALPDVGDATRYPDATVTATADEVEALIESTVGTSFVLRDHVETHDGDLVNLRGAVVLRRRFARELVSVTDAGVAVDLDELTMTGGVVLRRAAGTYTGRVLWQAGRGSIVVTYRAGYTDTPPADVKAAALTATRDRLLRRVGKGGGVSKRATTASTEAGSVNLATTSPLRPFGLPDVDVVVEGHTMRVRGPLVG